MNLDEAFAELDATFAKADLDAEDDYGRREFLDLCLDSLHLFSPWERDFIRSTYSLENFSPKQREIIHRLYYKQPQLYDVSWHKQLSLSNSTSLQQTPEVSPAPPTNSGENSNPPDLPSSESITGTEIPF